jgi:hypothetical protein
MTISFQTRKASLSGGDTEVRRNSLLDWSKRERESARERTKSLEDERRKRCTNSKKEAEVRK